VIEVQHRAALGSRSRLAVRVVALPHLLTRISIAPSCQGLREVSISRCYLLPPLDNLLIGTRSNMRFHLHSETPCASRPARQIFPARFQLSRSADPNDDGVAFYQVALGPYSIVGSIIIDRVVVVGEFRSALCSKRLAVFTALKRQTRKNLVFG
jgi:hypothetical protein